MTDKYFYRGKSMQGTFCPGDALSIISMPFDSVSKGDVIVFRETDSVNPSEIVVHRVVMITALELITRGDHNRSNDPPVLPGQVIGRVEFVETQRGLVRVLNGEPGLWWARFLWLWLAIDLFLRRLFWRPYNFIRQKRLAVLFWRPAMVRVCFSIGQGFLVKYLYRGRTIATWDSVSNKFACRKPFDLVIPPPLESLNTDKLAKHKKCNGA